MANTKNVLESPEQLPADAVPGIQDSARIIDHRWELNCPESIVETPDDGSSDPILEKVRSMVRTEFSKFAQEAGYESFEEANDFDVEGEFEDDRFVESPYMEPEYAHEQSQLPLRRPGGPEPSTAGIIDAQDTGEEGAAAVDSSEDAAPDPTS